MKKLVVLVSATVFCLSAMALPSEKSNAAGGERLNCKKVSIGTKKARMTLTNGDKMVMPIDQLEAYQLDGAFFEKKELFFNGKPTGKVAFMELLKTRGDLSLYRNVVWDAGIAGADKRRADYYVYRGDELYLTANAKALPNALNFFGVKWSYR
jgi:hypothetical protein